MRWTGRHVKFVPISEVNDSFDHLVGERQRCRGNGNAERFRGFEIDHEGKLARLLDRETAGPGASKEERHLVPSTPIRQNGCPNTHFSWNMSRLFSTHAKKTTERRHQERGSSRLIQRPPYHLALIPGTRGRI